MLLSCGRCGAKDLLQIKNIDLLPIGCKGQTLDRSTPISKGCNGLKPPSARFPMASTM